MAPEYVELTHIIEVIHCLLDIAGLLFVNVDDHHNDSFDLVSSLFEGMFSHVLVMEMTILQLQK